MDTSSSADISSCRLEEDAEKSEDCVEALRIDDLLLEQISILGEKIKALEIKISDQDKCLELRMLEIAEDRRRIAKLEHVPVKTCKKTDLRKKSLADQLVVIKNVGMTYSQIGKFLELGSRNGSKNTREQNMTHFGKHLEADKKNFIVTPGRTSGGKLVKLTKAYYDHLMMGGQP